MASKLDATILVVDDNPAGRYATSRILRGAGFSVLEAATGGEGLSLSRQADLMVLDVNLPDIDGFEVCRRIRSTSETARLPVIHLSATFVKDTDKVEGLEAGADGYLTHPVEPPVLVATVNAFLRTRRAEDEMRRSEAKFKAIFDQAASGILLVSEDFIVLEANPAVCRMLQHTREEIVGQHGATFAPAGQEHDHVAIAREVREHGAWRGMFPLIRADGAQVELEWSIARHSVPGVRLAIVSDVTERKAHEVERERLLAAEQSARAEAERANRLKDEFLATLSHELRTPLNAIMGWSQILTSGEPTPEEITEGIEAISRNAQAQAQLISDLLDVSRITSGKLRLDLRPVDLAEVVDAALDTVSPAAQAKGIHLARSLDSNTGLILADPDRIQQVIWNLVNNAVKFTPRSGTIRASLARSDSHLTLTISDNGQGIKPDFLPYIFERFRQEDATTKRNEGGLGLGLAITKHLVELHGGTISAQSEGVGHGSRFVVSLPGTTNRVESPPIASDKPATADRARTAPNTESSLPDIAASLHGIRIVIVDDDADARIVLRRVLIKAGAEVQAVASTQAALALLDVSPADVLISDVGMPGQDGYDLIRAVRAGGKSMHIPAIALTAFAGREDREQSLIAGFQLHLSKPVDLESLVNAVLSLARPDAGT